MIDTAGNDVPIESQQPENSYKVDREAKDDGKRPSFDKKFTDKRKKLKTAVDLVKSKYEAMKRGKAIDRNIRSVATQFNAINSRNVANFQPPQSDDDESGWAGGGSASGRGRPRRKHRRSKPVEAAKKEPKRKFKVRRQLGISNKIMFKHF